MNKTEELKQKAKVPNDSILAVVSVLSNDETELKLEKHKRYRFTESELSKYTQQESKEAAIKFVNYLKSDEMTGDLTEEYSKVFDEWLKNQQ